MNPVISNELVIFSGFLVVILFLLFLDLGLFTKKYHIVSFRESVAWTVLWVSLAIGFYFFLRFYGTMVHGIEDMERLRLIVEKHAHPIDLSAYSSFDEAVTAYKNALSLEYLTGYIIEYSLSVDNVFVILLIFISFGVKEEYYKKVLFWGILGAIVMRFIFIFSLSALITRFNWVLFLFGAFLIWTAYKMVSDFFSKKPEKIEVSSHPVVRFASRIFSVYPEYVGHKFWIRQQGKLFITPLFLVLLVIEFSDVIFAVDSVPAIFAVTRDPMIVFFSNIFAIIGLRSLFFLVANILNRLRYLKIGLAVLLGYIGVKMLLPVAGLHVDTRTSLFIILGILTISTLASLVAGKKDMGTDVRE